MKSLFLLTLASAVFAAACGATEAPAPSGQAIDDSPIVAADTNVSATAAPRRERASEAAVAARTPDGSGDARPPATSPAATPPPPSVPEYREVVIPAGSILPLTLASSVASDASQVEDLVRATLREDVQLGDGAVLPTGVDVIGRVVEVERSGRVKGRARVAFRFTRLTYEGDEYDLRTEAVERVAAATKGEDATKVAIGAAAGAALGGVLGGGSGAAKGAAIGAAAGTGAVLATRGEEVRLEMGEPVDTRLTAPLPLRVRVR